MPCLLIKKIVAEYVIAESGALGSQVSRMKIWILSLVLGRKSLKSVCLCVNKASCCLSCGKVVKCLLFKGDRYKCHVPGWSLCWAQRQNVISNDSYSFQSGTSLDPCAQMMSNFPFRVGFFASWCRRSCPERVPET